MTLGNMHEQGVRHLIGFCLNEHVPASGKLASGFQRCVDLAGQRLDRQRPGPAIQQTTIEPVKTQQLMTCRWQRSDPSLVAIRL